MKLREELETSAADADIVLAIFERLGLRAWFRSEKYREEFALHDVIIAIDDTPIGTFIEIEGSEAGIARTAEALGRGTSDYIVESYRTLYVQQRTAAGLEAGDMRFPS
jgi:adenylate cyclase class 2